MTFTEGHKKKVIIERKSNPTSTKPIYVPLVNQNQEFEEEKPFFFPSKHEICKILKAKFFFPMQIPLFESNVQAGIPSPIEEFTEGTLDLNQYLIKHEASTFFVRVVGESMTGAAIFPGDLLIVDRSVEATSGKIIIALLNGGLTVKRLYQDEATIILCAENDDYTDIKVTEKDDFLIWGIVTNVIHSLE